MAMPFAKDFKYAPGEADKISVGIDSRPDGYD